MPELLFLTSFDRINVVEDTQLSADLAAAATTGTFLDTDQFVANDYFRIGDGEQAEIRKISGVVGQVVTVTAAFTYAHKKYSKIVKLRGDKVQVYRAPNVDGSVPLDAAFVTVGSPIPIQADQAYVEYNDSTGGSDWWYKKTFVNSVTSAETSLAIVQAMRGGDYGHFAGIDEIINEGGLTQNKYFNEIDVSVRRDQADSEIEGLLAGAGYILPLQTGTGALFVPPVVANAARLLAAGYVMTQEYGVTSAVGKKNGKEKIKQAYEILDKITERKIILVDAAKTPLVNNLSVSGIPDDTTNDNDGPDFLFTMERKF